MANEIVKKENTALTFGASADLGEIFAEELDGLLPRSRESKSRQAVVLHTKCRVTIPKVPTRRKSSKR